jgi:phosphoglycerol transferase MdoB-like AlkP superfamily enzyme
MRSVIERVGQSLKQFIPASLVFAALFLSLRLYEFALLRDIVPEDISLGSLEFDGLLYDLIFAFKMISGVMILHILISSLLPRIASIVSVFLFTFVLMLAFGTIQYFSNAHVLLGPDLFGYTVSDIFKTITSSNGIAPAVMIFLPSLMVLMVVGFLVLRKRRISKRISPAVMWAFSVLLSVAWFLPGSPSTEDLENRVEYDVEINKTDFFITCAFDYVQGRLNDPEQAFKETDYPLLHAIEYKDSLGQYFNKSTDSPNLVFVIVEGMGRDFTGPGASYGGFTPFLDSLSEKSLYWDNFLSNAGRTFGALPSILGSLPYDREGFMSQGINMPDHYTLISLLQRFGYKSNFFYGGNAGFDNQDIFLEYQGFDQIVDQSKFPSSYGRDGLEAVSSWGYSDAELFSYASQVLVEAKSPRIDVYLTLSTHEPFIVPDKSFEGRFDERLQQLNWDEPRLNKARKYKSIFSCLLYTDNAIRNLIRYYQTRDDFNNTIFIITGDHRLIPLPPRNRIDRFHVPLIIYSPLVKSPHTFSGLSVHSDILPSVLSHLAGQYGFEFPGEMPFISGSLSTKKEFSSSLDLALIRYKNGTNDFVEGEYFLSDDKLYKILPSMGLRPVDDEKTKARLQEKLRKFKAETIYACEHNRLAKETPASQRMVLNLTKAEEIFVRTQEPANLTLNQKLQLARSLAFDKKYFESRSILKSLLNESPNFHDARILLGRTYGWSHQYDSAVLYLEQAVQRAPGYADAYSAWCDVEYWRGDNKRSLEIVQRGLAADELNDDLLARKARELMMLDQKEDARKIIDDILKETPEQELAVALMRQLNN